MPRKTPKATPSKSSLAKSGSPLLEDLRQLIEHARNRVARQVNTDLVMLNWHIGVRIRRDILQEQRAEYGQQIIDALALELSMEYGRAFERSALFRMVQFAEAFPDEQIVATLSQQLGWSHFRELLPIEDEVKRTFYAEMCRIESWSVRALKDKIRRMLFERTAIAKKPDDVAKQELALLRERGELSPDLVFRDPYLLDFLGLSAAYDEKDVENAILRELEQFLLELGTDFSFVARQKRLSIDGDDYYIDLLFFHRRLRRLVVVELKLGRFKAEHKGQLELYLRWLDKHERREGEESPIGLILCAGKSSEQIELLSLDASGIRVAEYVTEMLPKPVLAAKLHQAIQHAREHLSGSEHRLIETEDC
ncbi:MAG: DUF1016 family protein [Candidatus Melainabacteria bacterium]|nr:DUF1016 family protein [Candidatus Melainabacteria bacterium]